LLLLNTVPKQGGIVALARSIFNLRAFEAV